MKQSVSRSNYACIYSGNIFCYYVIWRFSELYDEVQKFEDESHKSQILYIFICNILVLTKSILPGFKVNPKVKSKVKY